MDLLMSNYCGLLLDGAGSARRRLSSGVKFAVWTRWGKYFHDWHLSVLPQPLIIVHRAPATEFFLSLLISEPDHTAIVLLGAQPVTQLGLSAQPINLTHQLGPSCYIFKHPSIRKSKVMRAFLFLHRGDMIYFGDLKSPSSSLLLTMCVVSAKSF